MTSPRTRSTRTNRAVGARLAAAIGAGLIAAGGLAVPATAAPLEAAPVQAHTPAAGSCNVDSATLTWGIKERLRSYVSGSIANGEWTVSDDMKYETPNFIWDKVTGNFDSALTEGHIDFTGAVKFTGHEGMMEINLANPGIEFEGENTAYLTLAIGSTDTAGAGGKATSESVRVAKIDLEGAVATSGTELTIDGAVPRITADGAEALNGGYGSYVAGDDMDPITVAATVSGCELGETEATGPVEPEIADNAGSDGTLTLEPAEESSNIPWLPIGIGAAALLIIGITGGMLLGGRGKKQQGAAPEADASGE